MYFFFFILVYSFLCFLHVKYALKEWKQRNWTSCSPGVNKHKSREQPSLTWCWFDEHNVVPLSLPSPSSVCWPKRVLFKTHKSHPPYVVPIIAVNRNKITFPFSSVVMLKTVTLKWPLPHIIRRTVCCALKRQAGDPSVPHMAPLSW